jgi:hypothetical protein
MWPWLTDGFAGVVWIVVLISGVSTWEQSLSFIFSTMHIIAHIYDRTLQAYTRGTSLHSIAAFLELEPL